jgi:hypothetical protein
MFLFFGEVALHYLGDLHNFTAVSTQLHGDISALIPRSPYTIPGTFTPKNVPRESARRQGITHCNGHNDPES